MFETATRMKLRFDYKGQCTVEDLWDLPLKELDKLFKQYNSKLKEQKEESLLNVRTTEDKILDLRIQIIKHIVNVKLKEKEERENKALKAEQKQKILKIIAEKKDKELYEKPVEDLEKLLADL